MGKAGLLFIALSLLGTVLFFSVLHLSRQAHAAVHQLQHTSANTTETVDAVVVLDNVSQIGQHDPTNARFAAASLFVDLASANDRIGTIEISGSPTPAQEPGYQPLLKMEKKNKETLKRIFNDDAQRGIDIRPTAYFTPALTAAGDMLKADKGDRQRYIILVTDTAAQSGDANNCPQATTPSHNWYCTVGNLERQGISVVLLAFFSPTSDPTEFQPTHDYINQVGGIAREFGSGANLAQDLATQYISIFSDIHKDIFVADMKGVPAKIIIDRALGSTLSSITFVALSDTTVRAQLQAPDHTMATCNNTGDSGCNTGSIYWLQTIATSPLDGDWRLTYPNSSPSDVLIIVHTNAHLDLIDPILSIPNSNTSVRYVPVGRTILHARLADDSDQPLTSLPMAVVLPICCTSFASSDTPSLVDSDPGDEGAVVNFAHEGDYALSIGIGSALQPGRYLAKQFSFHASKDIYTTTLTIPQSSQDTPLDQNVGVPISEQGVNNPGIHTTVLSLFQRSPGENWRPIGTSRTQNEAGSVTGTLLLDRGGCGQSYEVAVEEKVSGTAPGGKSYAYYTYDTKLYTGYLKTSFTGKASFISSSDLSWSGQSLVTWRISLSSTICPDQAAKALLNLTLQGKKFSTPTMFVEYSKQYTVTPPDSVAITAPHDPGDHVVLLNTIVGTCATETAIPLPPLWPFNDRIATLTLKAQDTGQRIPLQLTGDLQKDMTCPWMGTWIGHNPISFAGLFLGLIVCSRHIQAIVRRYSRKPYLIGTVHFMTNCPDLSEPDTSFPEPNSTEISQESRLHTWYLDHRPDKNSDGSYVFTPQWTSGSLLKFSIGSDEESHTPIVTMTATENARGERIPQIEEKNIWLRPMEEHICTGQRISIGHDILIPDMDISF